MHVKQVILEGFKSYKDAVITDPFSEKINVIVGANGSGKSNFFDAFLFVLDQLTATSHQEERQKLLHEGAGHAVMSAYVELVFDNSDGRLPVDKDEVRLRRTIGLKKDDYYLDKKHIARREVMDLLEAAGFSKSNPYYVVKQGKIMSMANMRDSQRLDLLKEIGGTKVYEERRKHSIDIMKTCDEKGVHIEDLIGQLDARLKELDEEREELAQYQALDKQYRSLSYTILDQEIRHIKSELDQVEEKLREALEQSGAVQDEMREGYQQLKTVERELKQLGARQKQLQQQQKELRGEKKAVLKRKAQAELDVTELQDRIAAQGTTQAEAEQGLAGVTKEIGKREKELAGLQRQLEELEAHEAGVAKELEGKERRQKALLGMLGFSSQFSSQAERDKWLQDKIRAYGETIKQHEQSLHSAQAQAAEVERRLAELQQDLAAKEGELREREQAGVRAAAEQAMQKRQRDELLNQQRQLFQQDNELESEQRRLKGEEQEARSTLERTMPRDNSRGINSVRRFVKTHDIQGMYGTLLELFSADERLYKAVERTAGPALWHIVVEDDTVATRLTELLDKGNQGRVTFMPLNRIHAPQVQYPDHYGKDVMPLMKRLKYDPKFELAIRHVFGKTLVCRSLEVARKVAMECNLNCITMDGDKVDKKGPMSGGFIDERRSAIRAFEEYKGVQLKMEEVLRSRKSVQEQLEGVQQQVTAATGQLSKAEAEQHFAREATAPLRAELRKLQDQVQGVSKEAEARRKKAADVEASLASAHSEKEEFEGELGTEMKDVLSAEERAELAVLQDALPALRGQVAAAKERRLEAAASIEEVETLLATNLRKQKQDYEDALAGGTSLAADQESLKEREAAAQAANAEVDSVAGREREVEKELEQAQKRIRELTAEKERVSDAQTTDAQQAEERAADVKRLRERKDELGYMRRDKENSVRKLGSLPTDAFEKYRNKPLNELRSKLTEVTESLKPLQSSINTKALDQYLNFTEQRDDLVRRKQENDQAQKKIIDLIQVLDHRKDEAVERTFKGVAKNFRDIFAQLVPGGRGELVMQKRAAAATGGEEEDEEGAAGGSEEALGKYSGVKVKVSFGGGETMSLKQLSGGQKTLVALALIFAIQRCDPAPFYLFDEIDAALDPQYRTTVASMLRQQATDPTNPAQFIVTTFHPQIVMVADRIYGVSHSNKISKIDTVDREDALEFLSAQSKLQEVAAAARGAGSGGEEEEDGMEED